MKTIGVIPARYGATRFEAKVLARLHGKPVLEHVWRQAKKARLLDSVLIATDDKRIQDVCKRFGAKAVLTSQSHQSGSDRIAEAVKPLKVDIVVNIQGDEPLVHPSMIDGMVEALKKDKTAQVSTVIKLIEDFRELENPNVVKVVVDRAGYAIYFSRCAIPYNRQNVDFKGVGYYKHLGLYAYRKKFLLGFKSLPVSSLEKAEQLEQLRVLQAGYKIKVVVTKFETIAVDTKEDLKRVEKYFKNR